MKRVFLFLVTNIAVMVVLSIVIRILGADRFLEANGINYVNLLILRLCLVSAVRSYHWRCPSG